MSRSMQSAWCACSKNFNLRSKKITPIVSSIDGSHSEKSVLAAPQCHVSQMYENDTLAKLCEMLCLWAEIYSISDTFDYHQLLNAAVRWSTEICGTTVGRSGLSLGAVWVDLRLSQA